MSLKRIRRELLEMSNDPLPNCSVKIEDEKTEYTWVATIKGPEGTPYAGGTYQLKICFPNDYPFKQPCISFETKIYHPNFKRGGVNYSDICGEWNPKMTLKKVLLSIINLLRDPDPDTAINK